MSSRLTEDDEKAFIRYLWATNPPATEPVPKVLVDSLRRIVESANPVDTLRHEFRYAVELSFRYYAEGGAESGKVRWPRGRRPTAVADDGAAWHVGVPGPGPFDRARR